MVKIVKFVNLNKKLKYGWKCKIWTIMWNLVKKVKLVIILECLYSWTKTGGYIISELYKIWRLYITSKFCTFIYIAYMQLLTYWRLYVANGGYIACSYKCRRIWFWRPSAIINAHKKAFWCQQFGVYLDIFLTGFCNIL